MANILFLCHRIPFPPNKGDKIRSFNLLKYLSREHKIFLGCYVDDPVDWKESDKLAPFVTQKFLQKRGGLRALAGAAVSLLKGEPLTLGFYRTAAMRRWVRQIIQSQHIDVVLVFSSSMAQYATQACVGSDAAGTPRRVIDFVDVDSDKWRQYANSHRGVMRWIYRREWQTLLQYERDIAAQFDASLFVSNDEAQLFRQLAPTQSEKIHGIGNGVDLGYFDPTYFAPAPNESEPERQPGLSSPYDPDASVVVFTGAMDYWANTDAVEWFCTHVWPRVLSQIPNAQFYIVGSNPSRSVLDLAKQPGVFVTGRVDDVRPYLHFSSVAVAPMQVARGVQNKILEAMAMGKPVVSTSQGFEGLNTQFSETCLRADEPEAFACGVADLLTCANTYSGSGNRRWVEQHFSWESQLQPLSMLLTEQAT